MKIQEALEHFELDFAALCELIQRCRIRINYDYATDSIAFDALELAYFRFCETAIKEKYS